MECKVDRRLSSYGLYTLFHTKKSHSSESLVFYNLYNNGHSRVLHTVVNMKHLVFATVAICGFPTLYITKLAYVICASVTHVTAKFILTEILDPQPTSGFSGPKYL